MAVECVLTLTAGSGVRFTDTDADELARGQIELLRGEFPLTWPVLRQVRVISGRTVVVITFDVLTSPEETKRILDATFGPGRPTWLRRDFWTTPPQSG